MKKFILFSIWSICQLKAYSVILLKNIFNPFEINKIKRLAERNALCDEMDISEQVVWKKRIEMAVSSPDNAFIPRVSGAGTFEGNHLVMHNGLKIQPISYYGVSILKMLIDNKGVHEPQEERIFQEVLKTIPENSTMIELGSYWAFYSMWFAKNIKGAKCYMIEPEPANLMFGKKNFRINGLSGSFYQSFIGNTSFYSRKGERGISVDDYVKKNKIGFVYILHSDIQGFEVQMLKGSTKLFESKNVGYVFISTHSNEKHYECMAFLQKYNFVIIAEANLDESDSVDGVIVAKAPYINGVEKVDISKRTSVVN